MIAKLKEALAAQAPQPTEQPQNDAMLKEMQKMLGEIEKAKSADAMQVTMEALRGMLSSQQEHQSRTMELASKLLEKD
jgi:hypothetical protein